MTAVVSVILLFNPYYVVHNWYVCFDWWRFVLILCKSDKAPKRHRRAFVQEFALITKEHKWLQLAAQRVLVKAPKFVLLAKRQLQLCGSSRLSVKHMRVADLLQKLQLALQHVQDDEVATRYRAIAGLLLMPHLLGDTVCYVYSICPDAYEPVCSPHAVARNEFEDPVYIHVDNEACLQANDMLDAFLLLVPVYFVLWLSYPRKANASYQYLQQELLGINDRKVPSKLACILERLND